MTTTTLLLLADGRFPSGGHAHSGGLEAAVAAGRVTNVSELQSFLRGRLATAGPVAAGFAAATHLTLTGAAHPAESVAVLDAELDARTASPAQRLASRRQGRALLRAGRAIWPSSLFADVPGHPDGCHHPIALGVTAAAAHLTTEQAALAAAYGILTGPASAAHLTTEQAALAAAYGILTGPASAAVRLLGLDPYHTQAVLARLAATCDAVAREAAARADRPPADLPAGAAPLADIHAETHATWEVRLFAS